MLTPRDYRQARRVFEETIAEMAANYAPPEPVVLDATVPDGHGGSLVVARYRIEPDGSYTCAEILHALLWPGES